ncbi:Hypothetical predicted protein [Olea europaea subsp. europaea]|uniref:Uncharacterized protein n=1 Tax=Olea europaea subsp. europaea TaxID=158383 RepID=A0A8S0P7V2_OLEEU|nr:Hypothetical predicted protein [Olea europaea subsp. europaea]
MYVVLAVEENTFVNPWLFYLVDDLDRFNNYSWGRKSYEYTIKVFKRNLGDMLKGYTTSQRYPYSLHGFPFAIMRYSTLNPTDDELLEPFWKESGPFDSEADPKLEKVASKDEGEKDSESDDAQSSFTRPQCPKTSDRPSMSSHLHSSKTARRPPPSYDYITHIIKQEIRGVEERLRGEMSDRFDRVERKIDLFLQLAGQGVVQSERSKFDDRAFSKGNQQNKKTRERDEVIIEECFHEEVTPNKQSEAFPTYDDGFLPDPSSAIVLYQQRPLVWTEETFRIEEARQDDVTEKVARTKEDSNISNKDDYEKPSTSSHVCQPSNEIIVIEDPNSELPIEVHCTLNPTDDELLEPFWKESGPFDSEADPKLEKVASKDEGEKDSESDDAQSSFTRPQCPKTSDRPSMSSHLHSSKTARRPPPSYDYITHIIKQEIRGVEERLRGEMSDRFDRVERKIDLFLQLAGQGVVQSERSKFDDRAFSKGNQQNKKTRERDEVIIEECFHEEVTPNKQSEAFPTYDDGFLPDPSSAIVLYQQRPLVWTEETFRIEEARQDDVTEKVARTKEDSNISNKDDYEKPSTSSHVCQPSNEIIVIEDPNSELPVGRGHRVKRRAALLLSPYTNPLKRRKLLNIQAYNPLREVDPAKVEDLNKWLANASTR